MKEFILLMIAGAITYEITGHSMVLSASIFGLFFFYVIFLKKPTEEELEKIGHKSSSSKKNEK
tara:strand:- start:1789 stop:1977 length:189 start_codon:yes stop_codon:yes gene_type:complete